MLTIEGTKIKISFKNQKVCFIRKLSETAVKYILTHTSSLSAIYLLNGNIQPSPPLINHTFRLLIHYSGSIDLQIIFANMITALLVISKFVKGMLADNERHFACSRLTICRVVGLLLNRPLCLLKAAPMLHFYAPIALRELILSQNITV
jgi:hypothetical protein